MKPCCAPCETDSNVGDLLPKIVWPSDVDDYVSRLDPQFRATDAGVKACGSLASGVTTAWGDFLRSWETFKKDASCVFGCANKYDTAQRFETELASWQLFIRSQGCSLLAPDVAPPKDGSDLLKWAVVGLVVAAAVYTVGPFVRSALSKL
jgi:hypothetical protein